MVKTLEYYLNKWTLSDPQKIDVESAASDAYIVCLPNGDHAVLKHLIGRGIEGERCGAMALDYFDGNGAVQILDHDEEAHLLEYLDGEMLRSLVDDGKDEQATEIIADIVLALHSERPNEDLPKDLATMERHFRELFDEASKQNADSRFKEAASIADQLLQSVTEQKVLHGDIHHENILHSQGRGWLAIDPRGIYGDPAYEVANVFNNPPRCDELVSDPKRALKLSSIFASKLGYDQKRVLDFAAVHMGASASWSLLSGQNEDAAKTLSNFTMIRTLRNSIQ